MTQENKELLLKDLCARLPYGVVVSPIDCGKAKLIGFKDDHPILFDLASQKEYGKPWEIEYIKPYLHPMSSMTEEEKDEYSSFVLREYDGYLNDDMPDYTGKHYVYADNVNIFTDWLNKHHFDYRGLIEKGLALEAPNGMYK